MQKKKRLEADEKEVENEVLIDFLDRTRREKQDVSLGGYSYTCSSSVGVAPM
jgi:hypothetical protein